MQFGLHFGLPQVALKAQNYSGFGYAACSMVTDTRAEGPRPEDRATELGIGLYEVTELVRRYQDSFRMGKAAAPLRLVVL